MGVEERFAHYEQSVFAKTNGLFWWLLLLQWAFGVVISAIWSPRTWNGFSSSIHPHLIAAVGIGGLLVAFPLMMMRLRPYHPVTRHSVAVAQVSFSALLIHLTGGRIETHFHVFGSLAFIALYRDWKVLVSASIVVALDHFLRGLFFPESVFGVPYATVWRTWEHTAWVVFEVTVLLWACFVSRREMREICQQQDSHQKLLDALEDRVLERTRALQLEVAHHERTARELSRSEERYRTLITNLPIGVFKITRQGEFRLANPHLLQMLKLSRDLDTGEVAHGGEDSFPAETRETLWRLLEQEKEVMGFETSLKTTTGESIDVMMNARWSETPGEAPTCEGTLEDVTEKKQAARELEVLHQQLVVASRQAGMADVATGVLHNVGNVLTSVNITVHDVRNQLKTTRLSLLRQLVEVFQREKPRLGEYLMNDPGGRQIPEFLAKLESHLSEENQRMQTDVESLAQHFDHIRKIIMTQQSSARLFGVTESLPPAQLIDDALKLVSQSFDRHEITVERSIQVSDPVSADRHKVLQILVNLLKNAKDAVLANSNHRPFIRLSATMESHQSVALSVQDSGVGMSPETLIKIFQHGFTTKANGHGFGLHSAILAAREMGGDLKVQSEGPGRGACFTLTLPLTPKGPS